MHANRIRNVRRDKISPLGIMNTDLDDKTVCNTTPYYKDAGIQTLTMMQWRASEPLLFCLDELYWLSLQVRGGVVLAAALRVF